MFYITIDMIKRARGYAASVGINIVVYIVVNLFMGIEGMAFLWQDNQKIIHNGEFYRLITSMFLHADFAHLFANCYGLIVFGTAIEYIYSDKECLLIYFITGFIVNLPELLINPYSISMGASGAVFGFTGAVFLIDYC